MATTLGVKRHDSSEDYEIIPKPNGPVVSSPFPIANPRRGRTPSPSPDRRSRSRSPFSYFNQLFAGRSRHEQVSARQQQESHEEAEAIAASVQLEVQAKLGVAITTYNVISFTKTKLGDGYAADYCIKVQVDLPHETYIYVDVRTTPFGGADLQNVTTSPCPPH